MTVRAILATGNVILAVILGHIAALVAFFSVMGWLSHPGCDAPVLLVLFLLLLAAAACGSLALFHILAYREITRRRACHIQKVLAVLYGVLCPIGIVWAAPGLWIAPGLTLLYLSFFVFGTLYGIFAAWACWRRSSLL